MQQIQILILVLIFLNIFQFETFNLKFANKYDHKLKLTVDKIYRSQ